MKFVVALIFLTLYSFVQAQSLDVTAGVNRSIFHDGFEEHSGRYPSIYETRPGIVLRFGLNDVKFGKLSSRVDLSIETYGGDLYTLEASSGSGGVTEGDVRKTTASLGFHPINFTFLNSYRFTSGITACALLYEKVSGYTSSRSGGNSQLADLDKDFAPFSAPLGFGARAG